MPAAAAMPATSDVDGVPMSDEGDDDSAAAAAVVAAFAGVEAVPADPPAETLQLAVAGTSLPMPATGECYGAVL